MTTKKPGERFSMSDNIQSEGTSTQETPATQTPAPPSITSIDQIPSALRNQLEANHKRGLQSQLAEAQEQLQQFNELKSQTAKLYEMLGDKIPEGSDLEDVASQIGGTLESLKTEKEKIEAANKKQAEALKAAQDQAALMTKQLHDTLIFNDLGRELGPKAVNAKAVDLIAKELHGKAVIGEDNVVGFKMEVTDENGHTSEEVIPAKDAVAQLEANADWHPFFKATVNSGVGGDVVDNVKRTGDGSPDLGALVSDPAKYMEIMEKNPALIEQMFNKR